jgi:hypothetical protein
MSDTLMFLFSLSILLPFAIGVVRFKNISKAYYPLIYLVAIGTIVEITSYIIRKNALVANLYVLIEFIFFCWLFHNSRQILKQKKWFYIIVSSFFVLWFIECVVLAKIFSFELYYRILYPFALVLLAVNQLNYLIINERDSIILNPAFILCCAMIIYFSYKCMIEIFYRYAPDTTIGNSIFSIHVYVNVLFNILLTLVVLCIPKKRTITLR